MHKCNHLISVINHTIMMSHIIMSHIMMSHIMMSHTEHLLLRLAIGIRPPVGDNVRLHHNHFLFVLLRVILLPLLSTRGATIKSQLERRSGFLAGVIDLDLDTVPREAGLQMVKVEESVVPVQVIDLVGHPANKGMCH